MRLLTSSLLLLGLLPSLFAESLEVTPVPETERARLNLDPQYAKYCSAGGFPVVSSAKVNDYALLEAAYLINLMLQDRDDLREALIDSKIRFSIMATDEFTLDVPEHSQLRPRAYWQKRARGLGSTDKRPAVSCGEENLLELEGDPYDAENILIHEFAHSIHQQGMAALDPTFDSRLQKAFQRARARGLWAPPSYAGTNHSEYWAEAVQSWFECNRANDNQHNEIDTRAELKEYDPGVAALVEEVFGESPWAYVKPSKRDDLAHLEGFDRANAPTFVWPPEIVAAYEANQKGEGLAPIESLPMSALESAKSPRTSEPAFLRIRNDTEQLTEVFWIDYEGNRKSYGKMGKGQDFTQNTYKGHLWLVTNSEGQPVGLYETPAEDAQAVIKP